jgi:hypothetical protein
VEPCGGGEDLISDRVKHTLAGKFGPKQAISFYPSGGPC